MPDPNADLSYGIAEHQLVRWARYALMGRYRTPRTPEQLRQARKLIHTARYLRAHGQMGVLK